MCLNEANFPYCTFLSPFTHFALTAVTLLFPDHIYILLCMSEKLMVIYLFKKKTKKSCTVIQRNISQLSLYRCQQLQLNSLTDYILLYPTSTFIYES